MSVRLLNHVKLSECFYRSGLLLAFSAFSFVIGLDYGWSAIFKDDTRIEIEKADQKWRQIARSVPALVAKKNLTLDPENDKSFQLRDSSSMQNFCSEERFKNQSSLANCSAALIGKKHIITAAHCVDERVWGAVSCQDYAVVFDYLTHEGVTPTKIKKDSVYSCEKVVYQKFDGYESGEDLAVIELDREVQDRKPLEVDFEASPAKNDPIVLMGYPYGLPLKLALEGHINYDFSSQRSFEYELDTFSANSGGPIFNEYTQKLIGIVVRSNSENTLIDRQLFCERWAVAKEGDWAQGNSFLHLKKILAKFLTL